MKKYKFYDKTKDYVMNKDVAIDLHCRLLLAKTNNMFHYEGLPETIPAIQLEKILQTNGNCLIAKVGGNLYALQGTLGGEFDEYERPTLYVVSNVWLNWFKEYGINANNKGDCVYCKNDLFDMGLLPIFKKFGSLLTENFITFRMLTISMRSILNISAPDDKTAHSAEEYLNQLENGKIGVIGENAFFDGVKLHNGSVNNNYISQFIELNQYLRATELQEIGVNANFNMKREYIGQDENSLNDDILRPFVDSMLDMRKAFCKECNETFGTNISVDFSSIWKTLKLEDEKEQNNTEIIKEEAKNPEDSKEPKEGDENG